MRAGLADVAAQPSPPPSSRVAVVQGLPGHMAGRARGRDASDLAERSTRSAGERHARPGASAAAAAGCDAVLAADASHRWAARPWSGAGCRIPDARRRRRTRPEPLAVRDGRPTARAHRRQTRSLEVAEERGVRRLHDCHRGRRRALVDRRQAPRMPLMGTRSDATAKPEASRSCPLADASPAISSVESARLSRWRDVGGGAAATGGGRPQHEAVWRPGGVEAGASAGRSRCRRTERTLAGRPRVARWVHAELERMGRRG